MSIENRGDRSGDRWNSRQERLNAQPLDWNKTRGKPGRDSGSEPRIRRPPGQSSGGLPSPDALKQAREAFPEEWKAMEESEGFVNFGTKDVFTQYCENCSGPNLNFPQVAIGKLFSNGGTCSASVVGGNNVIVTAAHCCWDRDKGDWIGGWSFAPAFRDGAAPFETFPWAKVTILRRWKTIGDRKSDVCVIRLGKNRSNRFVTFYTGWLGRSWNWDSKQVHHAVGYPGNIGNANFQELCVSESFSPSNSCGGSTVLNTGCSMTYGSSGGPWIRHYRGGGDWVNSVVSGYDNETCTGSFEGTFNGPRFTSDNIVVLCNDISCDLP